MAHPYRYRAELNMQVKPEVKQTRFYAKEAVESTATGVLITTSSSPRPDPTTQSQQIKPHPIRMWLSPYARKGPAFVRRGGGHTHLRLPGGGGLISNMESAALLSLSIYVVCVCVWVLESRSFTSFELGSWQHDAGRLCSFKPHLLEKAPQAPARVFCA